MAHRATSTAIMGTSTTASVVVPSSPAVVGDFAVLVTATAGEEITTDLTSSGWAVVGSAPTTSSGGRLKVWSKTLEAGDIGATINLATASSTRWALAVHVRSGVTQLYPTPVFNATSSSTTTPTCGSITATAGAELVSVYGCITHDNAQILTFAPPGGQTERADICSASGSQRNATLCIADETISTAGATGTRAATTTNGGGGDARVQSGTVTLAFVGNVPPVADAGFDQTVDAGDTVTLHGSGTDSDGTVASYAWTQISGTTVTLSSATVAEPTFTAPGLGSVVFGLTVTDNSGTTSAQDTVTVTVAPTGMTVKARVGGAWVTKLMMARVSGAWA